MKNSHPVRTVRSVALISLLLPGLHVAHGETITFREGQDNGFGAYVGTADTWIASASGSGGGDETATNYGGATSLKVEDDPAQSDGQGLIRFDNIIGNGAGQIPLGSTITSATLSITTVNGGFAAVPNAPGIHEMLVAWDEGTVTWDTFDTSPGGADGGMLPGVEYNGTAVDDANFGLANGETGDWDVTSSLQAWAAGGTNHGWMFFGDTNNGWDAYTSEFGTVGDRPVLTVEFTAPSGGAPLLLSSDIVDDQGGGPVSINTLVTYAVTFSEDMDDSTVTVADFDNAGSAGVSVDTVAETAPGVFSVGVTAISAGTLQLRVPVGAVLTDSEGTPLNTDVAILDDTTIDVRGPLLDPAEPTAVTDEGATAGGELTQAPADDVTLVWAETDEGATTIADWTSAAGGDSRSFGAVAKNALVSHILTGLPGDTQFFYRFVATAGTDSNWSSAKRSQPDWAGSRLPTGLAAVAGTTFTLTKVDLSWSDGFANETGFLIQRSTDPGFGTVEEFNVAADETAYIDLTTAPNTTYHYRIAGVGSTGPGPFSAGVSATTGDQPTTNILTFREGEDNGSGIYSGTLDINPKGGPQGNQALSYGANANINIEDDPGQEDGQGLIRFDNIFGAGAGQIPVGSTILSATLQVTTLSGGNADTSSGPTIHRMLMTWDESDAAGSWNYFVGGVDFNDVEAVSTPDDSLSGTGIAKGDTVSLDVLASLQAWSAGAPNHGWVLMGTTNNRWDIASSESSTTVARPALTVIYETSGTPSDYTAWASGYPGADLTDPNGDHDGDGLSNNDERIWGLDPTLASSVNMISVPFDHAAGTFSYTRRDPSLSGAGFTYQWSGTLAPGSWTPFTPAAETPDGASPVETVQVAVPASFLAEVRLFFRVVASEEGAPAGLPGLDGSAPIARCRKQSALEQPASISNPPPGTHRGWISW